ncbi:hypothetical protein E1292_25120 [Nonomuraea deserti]|uniref:WD40 repeat domain-containing protein n=1 Tax=Nonomuraea deserti TaxID=1848322 RepID=A0A4R4VGA6_9ACTN|nr:hypothetical protein [Nonomuraea deserti]TDD01713.1 hypothetical protein E1292_25120 [Nonomuraea deserti]
MRKRLLAMVACLVVQGCAAEPTPAVGSEPPPVPASEPSPTPPDEDVPLSARWKLVPGLPDDHIWERGLYDVSAASPDRAWAAGYKGWEDGVEMTLRHWDGSRWRRLPAGHNGTFAAVDADGPANVWAVGGGAYDEPVALHWDGRSWRRHRSPIKARDVAVDGGRVVLISSSQVVQGYGGRFTRKLVANELRAVSAGAGHTWIAGTRRGQPMVWHGSARGFEQAEMPTVAGGGTLVAVWQNGPSDVWAVGQAGESPLVVRWDGAFWKRVALPPGWRGELTSVTASGPRDVWIASLRPVGTARHVVLLHWDGRTWTRERSPSPGELTRAVVERIPGTSELWLATSIVNGDSESIVFYRRR